MREMRREEVGEDGGSVRCCLYVEMGYQDIDSRMARASFLFPDQVEDLN